MSDAERPIEIPWSVRCRNIARFRLQGILFLASVLALGWLWMLRTPRIVVAGQVQAVQVPVPASTDGLLVPLETPLEPFDEVHRGVTLVARFDVSAMLLEMQTLTAERDRMEALLRAESERLRLAQRQWDYQHEQQQLDREQISLAQRRTMSDIERHADDRREQQRRIESEIRELTIRKQEAANEQATVAGEIVSLSQQRLQIADLVERSMTPQYRLAELDQTLELKRSQNLRVHELVHTIEQQIDTLESQRADASGRLSQLTTQNEDPQVAASISSEPAESAVELDRETSLAPLEHALTVQDGKIRELAKRIAANEIRAPVSGKVSTVHYPPGTFVPLGAPILTIASDRADWIVVYLDQAQFGLLRENDSVQIRRRGLDSVIAAAEVIDIGSQYELMPEQLRQNAALTQYGLPVKVAVPDGMSLLPGELVDVVIVDEAGGPLSL